MKPEIYLKPCPPKLIKQAEQKRLELVTRYYYNREVKIIDQEEKKSLLYTFIYEYLDEEEPILPSYIIIADMKTKKWDTYSVQEERWGKKTLNTILEYCYRENVVKKRIDSKKYGMTLEDMQKSVNAAKNKKKWDKIHRKTQQDMAKASELTEGFKNWAARQIEPYLIYEKGKGNTAYCTRCKRTSSFSKKLKLYTKRQCPHCRSLCNVRTEKTMPTHLSRGITFIQRTDTGIMVRFIRVTQIFYAIKDIEVLFEEKLRVVINKGEKQIWYEQRGVENINGGWERNWSEGWIKRWNSPEYEVRRVEGLGGYYKKVNQMAEYKRNQTNVIKHSNLSYVDWEGMVYRVARDRNYGYEIYGFIDVYEKLHRFSQIESLWKLGYFSLACDLIKNSSKRFGKCKELHKWLGITKEMWRFLGNQKEKKKADISLSNILDLKEYDSEKEEKAVIWKSVLLIPSYHRKVFKDLPLKKVVRYIEKEDESLYSDYISVAKQIGYDLQDDLVAFPRDLQNAHDMAIEVQDEEKNKKKLAEAKKHDKGIAKVYKKIKKRFSFECGGYIIRPAASNYEIVKEGQTLHHCVGGGQYRDKMLAEDSYIVFLRKKEQPDKPYYTVEIKPDGKILQAYGKYNKKPDWETVGPILDEYSEKVRQEGCQKVSCRKTQENVSYAVPMAQ